jgi:hypothetical protein
MTQFNKYLFQSKLISYLLEIKLDIRIEQLRVQEH